MKREKVSCLYCEHYEIYDYQENISKEALEENGFCHLKNIKMNLSAEICSNFLLKKGMHTNKWYPWGSEQIVEDAFDYFRKKKYQNFL